MNDTQMNSGAHALPYRIVMQDIDYFPENLTLDELQAMAKFAGGDIAVELRGERLHLDRVLVREES